MSLADLGVSGDEERVYRFFLRHPGSGTHRAATALELPADLVAKAVTRLAAYDLLHVDTRARVLAVDPEVVMNRLFDRRLAEVTGELRRITAARTALPSLQAERASGAAGELVECIYGKKAVQARLTDHRSVAREILSMHPVRRIGVNPDLREGYLAALRDGLVSRSIVRPRFAGSPEVAAHMADLHAAGDRHRVLDEPFQMMVIYDREVAFVPLSPHESYLGALLIRQPGLVAALADLFERTWARATDLTPVPGGEPPSALTATERSVLDILTRVSKDEVGARELGISVRTFRRHVADLMTRLGAVNRFQAALLAQERGWIRGPVGPADRAD